MKIDTQKTSIESAGVTGQNTFSLKASAHAFQILSSGLYTNKIQAVIRELSCNAADAHVLNSNQKKAFDIKLPNKLDNQFYVRDYGPGLDEKSIMTLYTTYFDSTKQNSNDFTGGFGVGSKSPFAYTDSFTVESIHASIKTIYTAYTDEEGIPKIVKMGDAVKTDEPSGLSVGFPVKTTDYKEFEVEASNVLPWFNVPVNVLGSPVVIPKINSKDINLESDNLLLLKPNGSEFSYYAQRRAKGNALVSMGNVHYPLEWKNLGAFKDSDKLADAIKFFNNARNTPIFKIKVGHISVAASREALSHDKKSNAWLHDFLIDSYKEMLTTFWTKEIEPKITKNSTLKDYLLVKDQMEKNGISLSSIEKHIKVTPEQKEWLKDRELVSSNNPPKTFVVTNVSSYSLTSYHHGYNILPKSYVNDASLRDSRNLVFIENGNSSLCLNKNAEEAIKRFITGLKDKDRAEYFIVTARPNVKKDDYEKELNAWKTKLGVETLEFTKFGTQRSIDGIIVEKAHRWQKTSMEFNEKSEDVLWISRGELNKLTKAKKSLDSLYLDQVQKNLKFSKVIEDIVVVEDNDVQKMKSYKNGKHLIDDFTLNTLAGDKVQTKIKKISPMLEYSSSTFSALRAKYKKDKVWQDMLDQTKLGEWIKTMLNTKGSSSFDYQTRNSLISLKEICTVLGKEFNTHIPPYYKGNEIEKQLHSEYWLAKNQFLSKTAFQVDELSKLQKYILWREMEGAKTPEQNNDITP